MINDLRDFIQEAEKLGQLKLVENADWNLEIGQIADTIGTIVNPPMLLFDSIKGYPRGYRVATNVLGSPERMALALGFPKMSHKRTIVQRWRAKLKKGLKRIPPIMVDTGPVKDNVQIGDDVDLLKFPTPKWHQLDGGRYIGTGDAVITRDPDEGWVDIGTFRVQIHDKNTATIYMSPGKHANIIRRKYWDKGQSCPAVVVCGGDPLLFLVACSRDPSWGFSEYDYAGWMRNRPVEVTKGVFTDLPIPAAADIALEGEILPPEVETRVEGPFGEWTGYYVSNVRPEPAFRVRAVLHRNDPIILAEPPLFAAYAGHAGGSVRQAAVLWNELEEKIPGLMGVWPLEEARGALIIVISIKQMYAGHAKQAAMLAASSKTGAYHGRFIVVVDDDIDPFDTSEVLWAIATRCDPETQIDIVRGCWSTPLDPTISPQRREQLDFTNSRALILACKPYHWIKDFPASFKLSAEEITQVKQKWQWLFK